MPPLIYFTVVILLFSPLTTNLPYLIQYSPFPSDTITSLIQAGNSNSQILVNSNHTVLSSGIKGIYLECFKAADDSVNTIFNLFLKKNNNIWIFIKIFLF